MICSFHYVQQSDTHAGFILFFPSLALSASIQLIHRDNTCSSGMLVL
jgi:hypothetical protein